MPGKYWRTLKFSNDEITNSPEEIVEALHSDFGRWVYLYFRSESLRTFSTYSRIAGGLTPYTSEASREIFGQPAVKNPRKRFMNMILYFRANSRYFKQVGHSDRAVLFEVIE